MRETSKRKMAEEIHKMVSSFWLHKNEENPDEDDAAFLAPITL